MRIVEVTENKKQYLDLLLLADEQEDMVDRYLNNGKMYVLDDDGMKCECVVTDEKVEMKSVRFRTLGCYPLTGGVESTAKTLDEIIDETLSAVSSERTTRVIDNEAAGSMERRKREGYF